MSLVDIVLATTDGWLECAGWLAHESEDYRGGPFSGAIRIVATRDCRAFIDKSDPPDLVEYLRRAPHPAVEYLGHDIYLSQHGHGSGFWDREWLPREIGDRLTEVARTLPEHAVYVDATETVTCG